MKATPPIGPAQTGHERRLARRAARAVPRGRVVSAPAAASRAAFTLAEILIAMALIVIVGGLAVANLVHISTTMDSLPPEKVLLTAVREARFLALQHMSPTVLRFNNEELTFDIMDEKGIVLEQIKANVDPDATEFTLTFTPILPLKDLNADYPVEMQQLDLSRQTTSRLIFQPTGATTPVKVNIKYGLHDFEFLLDPFSEGPPPKAPEGTVNADES